MKKITSIFTAFLVAFFFSVTVNAQNVASDTKKSNDTECVEKQEKECKKIKKGFNFTKKAKSDGCCKAKSNTTAKQASCDSKAKQASCDTKAKQASCDSKAKQSSCCSKTAKASNNRDAATKVRQAIAKGEITPKQGNARLARLQKENKK